MVQAQHGDITYARATADHRALWYLSLKKGSAACGDVVRADIDGRTSTIVTHAVAFDVSPDGSRLALYGAGDLAHDRCTPVNDAIAGRVVVLDRDELEASPTVLRQNVTSLRWSPDGTYLVSVSCTPSGCAGYDVVDVPGTLGGPLAVEPGARRAAPARLVHSVSVVIGPLCHRSDACRTVETTTPHPPVGSVGSGGADRENRSPLAAHAGPSSRVRRPGRHRSVRFLEPSLGTHGRDAGKAAIAIIRRRP